MDKITSQFMPHVRRAPWFLDSVQAARRRQADSAAPPAVVQRLDDFENDPFLLYACLWYAYSEGVAVTFPSSR